MAGLPAKDLHEQIGGSICHSSVVGKLLGRGDQHGQLHQLLKPIQVATMLFGGCQGVERRDARGFLAFLD